MTVLYYYNKRLIIIILIKYFVPMLKIYELAYEYKVLFILYFLFFSGEI